MQDELIHESSFASVTCRNILDHTNSHCTIPSSVSAGEKHINFVAASDDHLSFNHKISFVNILDIVPTPLLVCGLDQSSPHWVAFNKSVADAAVRRRGRQEVVRRPTSINEIVNEAKPFYLFHGTIRKSFATSSDKVKTMYSSQNRVNVSALVLVDLHRHKNHYDYENSNDQWYKSWSTSSNNTQKENINNKTEKTYQTHFIYMPVANFISSIMQQRNVSSRK
jgi:hypothetical protein